MKQIGRYIVQERIGQGAMADVFRAHDPGIDRVLAIKVLKSALRQNEHLASRFVREAKAAGALSHANIVTIYDVGDTDGYPYIAMELLDGVPLDVAMLKGKLSIDTVISIGLQLAQALSYAHNLGVIHRDIKPSNVMLATDGCTIKILDFGIARVADADADDHDTESVKTQVGQILGTPRYMSPEQAQGDAVDGRSDLFSVGLVLYELITGRKAFVGASSTALALEIALGTPTRIEELAPDCPRGLQFIVNKLLAKRPDRRFANGAQLVQALTREQKDSAAVSAEAATQKRHLSLHARLALLMASITAVVLVASIGTVIHRQYEAMERMALTSGTTISSFIANNAALPAVDNAALPRAQRDWMPVQAFVKAAAQDRNLHDLMVIDSEGVIQAATDPKLIGKPYRPTTDEQLVRSLAGLRVTSTNDTKYGSAFRFVRTIMYAGRSFGIVDLSFSKAELEATASLSLMLLTGLAILTLGVVILASYTAARLLAEPIRRLKSALQEATLGNFDFRISHLRKDEFGELFDDFNLLAASVQQRGTDHPSGDGFEDESLESTRVLKAQRITESQIAPSIASWFRRHTA